MTVLSEHNTTMKDGTITKPLYIKHLSLADWELLEKIKLGQQEKDISKVVRWCIRRAANII